MARAWKFEGRVSSPRGWARLSEPGWLTLAGRKGMEGRKRDGGKEKARRDGVRRREGKGFRRERTTAAEPAKGCIGDLALRPEMDAALF